MGRICLNKSDLVRRILREAPHRSARDIAKEVGCSPTLVSNIRRNKSTNRPVPAVLETPYDLANAVRERIKELRPSLASLAQVAGVHTATISNFARGRRQLVHVPQLFALAHALGIRITVEKMSYVELENRHPARRLTRGYTRRSVWYTDAERERENERKRAAYARQQGRLRAVRAAHTANSASTSAEAADTAFEADCEANAFN